MVTGGCAKPRLGAAKYFGCFNGAVRSVSGQTGMKEGSMVGGVKDRGEGAEGREISCQAK